MHMFLGSAGLILWYRLCSCGEHRLARLTNAVLCSGAVVARPTRLSTRIGAFGS